MQIDRTTSEVMFVGPNMVCDKPKDQQIYQLTDGTTYWLVELRCMRLIEMTESYLGIIRTMISKLTLLVGLYKRDLFFLVNWRRLLWLNDEKRKKNNTNEPKWRLKGCFMCLLMLWFNLYLQVKDDVLYIYKRQFFFWHLFITLLKCRTRDKQTDKDDTMKLWSIIENQQ